MNCREVCNDTFCTRAVQAMSYTFADLGTPEPKKPKKKRERACHLRCRLVPPLTCSRPARLRILWREGPFRQVKLQMPETNQTRRFVLPTSRPDDAAAASHCTCRYCTTSDRRGCRQTIGG